MTLTRPYEATFKIGNGEEKAFSFLFDEVSENFIKVIVKRADGSIYIPTFSVDMDLKQVVFGEDEITPTAEDIICIYRDTPTIQDTQFNTLQGYNAKALENILSKIVAMIQEMKSNGFSTQILQGEPWGLDLIKPADDGASVQIDYQARVLKKGLYFKMSDGNLQVSANGVDFVQMPKSAEVKEFRHRVDTDGNIHFEYRVDKDWIELRGTAETYDKSYIDNQVVQINAAIDANADAIQKTREDFASADQAIRDDMNAEDSRLQTQITAHATAITTNRNDIDDLGDDVAEIQAKIPESASGSNQLATSSDLNNYVKKSGDSMSGQLSVSTSDNKDLIVLHGVMGVDGVVTPTELRLGEGTTFHGDFYVGGNPNGSFSITNSSFVLSPYPTYKNVVRKLGAPNSKFAITYTETLNNGAEIKVPTSGGTLARIEDLVELRADINEADSELQTQITAQAAEIATKQDQLTAGDNIIISGNIISATGAGGGVGFDVIVVQELPESGQKGIIYLVPKDSAVPDIYDEYVWVTTTSTFELIGSTKVDLTGYVKNTDYATSSKGGVFKTSSSSYATSVTGAGFLSATSKSLSAYNDSQPTIFISKGTLENIKEDLVARAIENAVNTQNLTVGTDEGTLNLSITAGVATIATNNGLDIAAKTKFDTAPTTDDNTTYADALEVSLMRKAQVATAISDAMANVDALPSQSGNEGKVLSTNGSEAEWTEMPGLIIRRL